MTNYECKSTIKEFYLYFLFLFKLPIFMPTVCIVNSHIEGKSDNEITTIHTQDCILCLIRHGHGN